MAQEKQASGSIFEDAPGPGQRAEATPPACSCGAWWKVALVVVLLAAVAGIIASKRRGTAPAGQPTGAATPSAAQRPAPPADNPLDKALATGRPVVADFGRGLCIPCKMMKPILDDLKEEYAGRTEILIIEIDEYPAVTQRVGIRAIPTQIFYDAQGKELDRHQGFLPREDIVAKLAEMGVK